MIKWMFFMLIAVGVIFGGIYGYHSFGTMMMNKNFSSMKAPAVTVSTVKAETQPWQVKIKAVGTLRAQRSVALTSEISGQVQEVFIKSGESVEEGKLLLRLNADTDIAQLRALQASANLARTIYARDQKQFELQAVSKAVIDSDAAELKVRRAIVAQQMHVIVKKFIRAPFNGQLGICTINRENI